LHALNGKKMEMLPPFKIHNDYLELSSWMDGQFSLISDRKLSQIALPGSRGRQAQLP
jgi:hypothetical protein